MCVRMWKATLGHDDFLVSGLQVCLLVCASGCRCVQSGSILVCLSGFVKAFLGVMKFLFVCCALCLRFVLCCCICLCFRLFFTLRVEIVLSFVLELRFEVWFLLLVWVLF